MNEENLLYRQINICHVQNDYVSSAAFRPRKNDDNKLSVYDGNKITPEESFRHYSEELKGHSEGVMAVSKAECETQQLKVLEDYQTHPYHMLIDFLEHKNNSARRISEYLRDLAVKRDWLYRK